MQGALIPAARPVQSSARIAPHGGVAITEYAVHQSIAGQPAVGPNGDVWFGSSFVVTRVSMNGTVKTFDLPDGYCPFSCTLAEGPAAYHVPDNTVWFTASFEAGTASSGGVASIDLTGALETLGTVPTFFGGPTGNITFGPDGRAWLPQCGANPGSLTCWLSAVGKTSGESDYSLGGYSGNTVTSGRDGKMYLTETAATSSSSAGTGASSVLQMSVNGRALKRFPLPDGTVWPNATAIASGIAAGRNGDLWIVEHGINKIARLHPHSGKIDQFTIPTPNADARNIVLGVDGNLWFTEFGANKIGTITNGGKITEYPVPTPNAGVDGIMGPNAFQCTRSAHGFLWVGEDNTRAVAKITF